MMSIDRCLKAIGVVAASLMTFAAPASAGSDCCVANGSPGCDNAACETAVCALDPFCCNNSWDGLCADAANEICAVCGAGGCEPACSEAKENVECLSGVPYDNRTFVGRFSVGCTAWIIAEPNLVITNAHCNNGNPANWSVEFNFECDSCTGGSPKPTTTFDVDQVLLIDNVNDIMIMTLDGNPAGQFGVATLDPSVATVGLPIYEIHHAAGQVKGADFGEVTGLFLNVNCPGSIQEHTVSVIASQGASGSPVFRVDNNAVTAICNCGPPCSPGFVLPMSTVFPFIQQTATDNGYVLQVVGQAGCGDDAAGNCCESNGSPFCDDAACCEVICADDPFCCDNTWDQICADAAILACVACGGGTGCGDPTAGDCCEANGSPFCDDAACCELICAEDPFCCETSWDGVCAGDAAEQCAQCFQCGSTEAGSCCESNGTPFCDNAACCETVCAADPFCCETEWDGLCASDAAALCGTLCNPEPTGACCLDDGTCQNGTEENCIENGGTYQGDGTNCADVNCPQPIACGSPETGNCCEANGTPFCDNAACCETVCAADPFCCETEWDGLCAEGAAELCGTLCAVACAGDINADGNTDALDLGILLGNFGGSGAGDLNNDGVVDALDLGILLGDFGCGG